MNIEQLISQLNKIENKQLKVVDWYEDEIVRLDEENGKLFLMGEQDELVN